MRSLIKATIFSIAASVPLIGVADQPSPATTGTVIPAASTSTVSPASAAPPVIATPSLYSLTANSLDGKPVDLSQYTGHVALVVNTASRSGYAQQFGGLEKLYQNYKDKGFIVLAFPSNDFGQMEPGSAKDIATTYANFKVTYPVFDKVITKGDGQSPIYHFLATGHNEPTWNFHKYLVDKTGKVVTEFSSQTTADNKDLLTAIEAALK